MFDSMTVLVSSAQIASLTACWAAGKRVFLALAARDRSNLAQGRTRRKADPSPSMLSKSMVPPWASARRRLM